MAPPTNPLAVASRTRVTRSLATQRALRALDGNCHQQQHDRGEAVDSGCSRDVAAAAARPPVLAPPGAPAGQAPLPGEKSTFVSAATQDAVAAACESDHLKHLRLSPGGGVSDDSGEDADSPPFTERESPAVETAAEEDAGVLRTTRRSSMTRWFCVCGATALAPTPPTTTDARSSVPAPTLVMISTQSCPTLTARLLRCLTAPGGCRLDSITCTQQICIQ
jgi:hypothetical protein